MDIQIKRLEVGQMKANCYIVYDNSKNAIIIDAGDDADYITNTISDLDVTPKAIISTHGHFDHNMAALEIKLAYKIPFYIHKDDIFLLDRLAETSKYYVGFDPGPAPDPDFILKGDAILEINNFKFNVIHTPGHSPGSVSLYLPQANALFVGDVIFADGFVGRTDFSYADAQVLEKSVQRLRKLPIETTFFPGHGEAFSL
ncbi:MBL fold metallo-hydrolase [Candidatus Microgenomates bacterium]|nr:MAG: MBL fold metallo-hydrolase [Candidatus Microgenomates bacterium]